MARIRTIKPKHVEDKELTNISLQAHLLWVLSWCFSDDEGVLENDPLLIKSQIFPRRADIRVEQVSQWLDQLVKARFIIPFEYNGSGYYLHRTFKTHQKIDKPNPSSIPLEVIRRILDEYSSKGSAYRVEESIVEERRVSGKESSAKADDPSLKNDNKKSENKAPPPEIVYPYGADFLSIWDQWKQYKQLEFKFRFKSPQSEQAAINELTKMCGGVEANAIAIINQSMAKGWKGLFELKNEQSYGQSNSKTKQATGGAVDTGSILAKINAMPG